MSAPNTVSTPSGGVVVVGSLNADLNLTVARHPRPGETVHGGGGGVSAGGKGANQAVAAALLGAPVTMVGAVGDDPNAQPALEGLQHAGADLTHVRHCEGTPTGLAVVTVAQGGENSIIVVPGANGLMDAAAVAQSAEVIAAAAVVVLQGEIPRDGIEEAARRCTGRLILNPAPVLELDPEVMRRADPLVVNEHEAALVLAQLQGTAPMSEAEAADDPERIARELRAVGVRTVVITLGAAGSLVLDAEMTEPVAVPAAHVSTVDTTGAGDAFIGALATRLLQGEGLVDAARFAARVGAFAVTSAGAQPSYPSTEDSLPALMDEQSGAVHPSALAPTGYISGDGTAGPSRTTSTETPVRPDGREEKR